MYIFISHSSKDAKIATELCNLIESNGSQCFLAPRNIRSGFEYAAEIVNGIDSSDAMLLLLSENSNSSPHILREVERAVSKSIPIIVYKLEDVVLSKSLEYFLMTHQWLNAEYGTHVQLLRCIDDLKNDTSTSIPAIAATNNTSKHSRKLPVFIAAASAIVAMLAVFLLLTSNSDNDNENTTTEVAINTTFTTQNETNSSEISTTTAENDNSNSTEQNTSESTTKNPDNSNDYKDIKLGDTVVFGRYNGSDIYWKVIKKSEDGKEAVLIAKDVLTFKAFDSANTGKYGRKDGVFYSSRDEIVQTDMQFQADIFGNSCWQNSDIRAWLNSSNESVAYEGLGPIASAMSDNCNAYNLEAGFLYNFTDTELGAIKETSVNTKGNAIYEGQTITTKDKVFLLSIDELEWLDNANVSRLAVPTSEAISNNESSFYKDYSLDVFHTDATTYWLRDAVDGSSSNLYQVGHGASANYPENIFTAIACCDGYGVRPAITIDLTSNCIKIEK